MKKYFEKRIKNAALLKCLRELGTDAEYELKEVLRKEFYSDIEGAVWHRISDQKRTTEIPDKNRKSLRLGWDGNDCPVCGKYMHYKLDEECVVEVEHIIERALGGSNELSNLVPCCDNCNRSLGCAFNEYVVRAKSVCATSRRASAPACTKHNACRQI